MKIYNKRKEWKKVGGLGYKVSGKIFLNKNPEGYNINDLPFPDWCIFPLKSYKRVVSRIEFPIQTARGCPHQCIFCSVPIILPKYMMKSPKKIVDEIEQTHKKFHTRKFQIQDDNFALSKQRVLDICDEIINRRLKIKWSVSQGFTAQSGSYELFKKMKEK